MLVSRWEGFGLALPEYMMAGKPIVATRADAILNIIKDGENGLLVDIDDALSASEAVIAYYSDLLLKKHIIESERECVYKYYNVKRVAEEHKKLLNKMV